MSIWTYVSGSVGLETSAFKFQLNKDGTCQRDEDGRPIRKLVYPKEQLMLGRVEPMHRQVSRIIDYGSRKGETEEVVLNGFCIEAHCHSYPIIKRIVDANIRHLPQGESECITYSLIDDINMVRSSSSDFSDPQVEKLFQQQVMEKFPDYTNNWEEYTEYRPVELSWEEHYNNSILTIHDSIRYCDANEFYEKLIIFFKKLVAKNIEFTHGHFCFYDYYNYYNIDINDSIIYVEYKAYNHMDDNYKNAPANEKTEIYQVFYYDTKNVPLVTVLKKVDKIASDNWIKLNENGEELKGDADDE